MSGISEAEKSILFDNILNELPKDCVIHVDFYKKVKSNLKNKDNVFKITLGLFNDYIKDDVDNLFRIISYLSCVEIYNYSSKELPEISDLKFNNKSDNLLLNASFKEFESEYIKIYSDLKEFYLNKIKA